MGQRHQLFVIAKVGARWRVLAGVHIQWLYGVFAVDVCGRMCKILQANAPAIRQELQCAADFDWSKLATLEKAKYREREEYAWVFPVLTTALVVGAGVQRGGGSQNAHLLPIDTTLGNCDNNDGFTIFDVTNPDKLRYCFLLQGSSERLQPQYDDNDEEIPPPTGVEADTPLEAALYLAAYDEWRKDVQPGVLSDLSRLSLVSAQALRSTWPKENFPDFGSQDDEEAAASHAQPKQMSLRDMALAKVFKRALSCDPEDLSWLAEAELLPDFADHVRLALQNDPSLVHNRSGLSLLARSLRGRKQIDLSYFPGLTNDQLVELLGQVRKGHEGRLAVTLPSMHGLTLDTIRKIAQKHAIDELHFGHTKQISGDIFTSLATDHDFNVRVVTHPSFYEEAFKAERELNRSKDLYPKLQAQHRSPIIQVLYARACSGEKRPTALESGGVKWSVDIPKGFSAEGFRECFSGEGHIIPLSVEDASCSLSDLLTNLPGALAELLNAKNFDLEMFNSSSATLYGVAKALALGSDYRISPIPASLYASWRLVGRSNWEILPQAKDVRQDSWTILICSQNASDWRGPASTNSSDSSNEECNRHQLGNQLRYAFVTRDNDGHIEAIDAAEFVRRSGIETAAAADGDLANIFLEGLSTSKPDGPPMGVCSQAEAEEAIEASKLYNQIINASVMRRAGPLASYRESHADR